MRRSDFHQREDIRDGAPEKGEIQGIVAQLHSQQIPPLLPNFIGLVESCLFIAAKLVGTVGPVRIKESRNVVENAASAHLRNARILLGALIPAREPEAGRELGPHVFQPNGQRAAENDRVPFIPDKTSSHSSHRIPCCEGEKATRRLGRRITAGGALCDVQYLTTSFAVAAQRGVSHAGQVESEAQFGRGVNHQ